MSGKQLPNPTHLNLTKTNPIRPSEIYLTPAKLGHQTDTMPCTSLTSDQDDYPIPDPTKAIPFTRRQATQSINEGSYAAAASALDKSCDLPCGVSLLRDKPDLQTIVQSNVALDVLGDMFELPLKTGSDANDDLKELAKHLASVVVNKDVVRICNAVGITVDPTGHADETVESALQDLKNPKLGGEPFVRRLSSLRASTLIGHARRLVLQRSVDSSLAAEVGAIRSSLETIGLTFGKTKADQTMVNLKFSAQAASTSAAKLLSTDR